MIKYNCHKSLIKCIKKLLYKYHRYLIDIESLLFSLSFEYYYDYLMFFRDFTRLNDLLPFIFYGFI